MKHSHYNFDIPGTKEYLIYNALTGGFAKLECDEYEKYCSTTFDDTNDRELLENLKKGGFILPEDFDELEFIDERFEKIKCIHKAVNMVISPTMKCNLACIYCYQNRDKFNKYPLMSQEIQDELVSFVRTLILENTEDIESLKVLWYGGEPLMAFPILCDLTRKFMEVCEEYGIEYIADMVTNGTLVPPRIEEFSTLQLRKFQITLDGDPSTHNTKRVYKNGEGTFDQILEGIKALIDHGYLVSLRINIDETVEKNIDALLDVLEDTHLKDQVNPYFGKLREFEHSSHEWECYIQDVEGYSDTEQRLYEKLADRGFRLAGYPFPRYAPCASVVKYSNISVDPEGYIYKCWHDIGVKEEAVGHVRSGFNGDVQKWLDHSPFNFEDCKECRFLPVCMGGCPLFALNGKKECISIRYNIEDYLKMVYKSRYCFKIPYQSSTEE